MSDDDKGPDLTRGILLTELPDGALLAGRVGEDAVVLARCGEEIFALGAHCPHYGGPLAEGLLVDGTLRCPWHHACFSVRSGEALRAPAFDALPRWRVEREADRVLVREKLPAEAPRRLPAEPGAPRNIVILGGGAAGFAAAERLRREGYAGSLILLSDDADAPYDRPNLSKDVLSGQSSEDQMPLRPAGWYAAAGIDLRLGTEARSIEPARHCLRLEDGSELPFDRLLIATGAEPVRPRIPGAEAPEILTLRSWQDCRTLIARAGTARRAVIIGASFIGLEVAAALRQRGLAVTVVAPEDQPLGKLLGPALAAEVRQVHESRGVTFRLGAEVTRIGSGEVVLAGGEVLAAELILLGTGVQPRTALAEAAGLAVENGVLVDANLETSVPGIFAAGDVARWPAPHGGARIRVEHWVVAERMGQAAALAMLGRPQRFDAVPFFWSRHYDALNIDYLGHATTWEQVAVDGDLAAHKAVLRYLGDGRVQAVATLDRDLDCLRLEAAMEAGPLPG